MYDKKGIRLTKGDRVRFMLDDQALEGVVLGPAALYVRVLCEGTEYGIISERVEKKAPDPETDL